MRKLFLVPLALVTATPAMAKDRAPVTPPAVSSRDLAELGDTLSNPVVQDTVAAVVDRFAAALLDTRVGPMARYTDPRDHVRADDTLGSVIAKRDPAYADKLHEQTRQLVKGAGQAAGDAAAMSSELARTTARLRALLDQTRGALDAAH